MDTTRIEKRIGVRASSERIWDVITAFDQWAGWNPYETDVSGHLSFNGSISLIEALPGHQSRQIMARLGDWQPMSQLIWTEKRGFLFNATRYYKIEQLDKDAAILSHGVILTGLRGELFHDKHRQSIRTAYEEIAEGLKRAAEG